MEQCHCRVCEADILEKFTGPRQHSSLNCKKKKKSDLAKCIMVCVYLPQNSIAFGQYDIQQ